MRDSDPQLTPEQGRRGCLFFAGIASFAYLMAKAAEWLFNLLGVGG